jgi:predicted transcriptional regulator
MIKNVITLYEDEPIINSVKKFNKYYFGRYPILNSDGICYSTHIDRPSYRHHI